MDFIRYACLDTPCHHLAQKDVRNDQNRDESIVIDCLITNVVKIRGKHEYRVIIDKGREAPVTSRNSISQSIQMEDASIIASGTGASWWP